MQLEPDYGVSGSIGRLSRLKSGTTLPRGEKIEMGVISFAHYLRLWELGPDKDKVRHNIKTWEVNELQAGS